MFGISRRRAAAAPVSPAGSGLALLTPGPAVPDNFTMLPHRVSSYRRPAFWSPVPHFQRREFLVSPPNLPGTAIRWTLFHPVYIPGLQGWSDVLPWNFGWAWGRNNFERFQSLRYRLEHPVPSSQSVTSRTASWLPQMRAQPFGEGRVWQQPRPSYQPIVINPQGAGGGGRRHHHKDG